jgi:NAD+ synthase (glutamine-hydrolysing)
LSTPSNLASADLSCPLASAQSQAISQWTTQHLDTNCWTLAPSDWASLVEEYRRRFTDLNDPTLACRHWLLAQINPSAGDLAGNMAQIAHWLKLGTTLGVGWVVFPELALMGYPVRDVIMRHRFLADENVAWLKALAAQTDPTAPTLALVGFIEPRPANAPGKPFYNAAAIIGQGQIHGIVRKSLLPTYSEFEDIRTFEPSPQPGVWPAEALGQDAGPNNQYQPSLTFSAHSQQVGVVICEDGWNLPSFFDQRRYHTNPLDALAAAKPDVLINLSASPSRARKPQLRQALLSHTASHYQVPLVYVNQVGAIDECSFDGGSALFDAEGRCLTRADLFAPTVVLVNPDWSPGPQAQALPLVQDHGVKTFTLDESLPQVQDELARTYHTLCQGIRDYFAKTGFQRAVLGLSGGLDSSVTAALLAASLGPSNVLGVSMPSTITPGVNQADARLLATQLGIHFLEQPIPPILSAYDPARQAYNETLQSVWGQTNPDSAADENLQAMTRATLLRLMGNDFNALPIATSDKSELYLGYATINGDMSGALAPLGDVPKTKVFALGRWINAQQSMPVIPVGVLERPPSADLRLDPATGQPVVAESALMPYAFADEVIWRIEVLNDSYQTLLATPLMYEQTHPLMPAQKQAWLDKFFSRMTAAVFKWWVVPPIVIVSGNGSITKTDYHHPITASRIAWQGHRPDQKQATIAAWLGN